MADIAAAELVAEVEAAAKSGPPERRVRILQRVAELFVSAAGALLPEQVAVFDEVLARLIERVEGRALATVAATFAELSPAPRETIRRLARHEDATVASPILLKSQAIPESDLAQIAGNGSQRHLLAIAGRPALKEQLTDLILKRAGRDTARALAGNAGARFSDKGYSALVAIATTDEGTAELLGLRRELPAAVLRELLSKTTDTVRARLLKAAPAVLREKLEAAIRSIAAVSEPQTGAAADYSEALAMVDALNRIGKLNDSTVNRFAVRCEYTNIIAALSVLSGARTEVIEPLMDEGSCEGLILACRASRLTWQTTLAVIKNRRGGQPSREQLELGKQLFETLYVSAAQYTMRFEPPTRAPAKPAEINNTLAMAEAR